MTSETLNPVGFRRVSIASQAARLQETLNETVALPPVPVDLLQSALLFCGRDSEAAQTLVVNYCRERQNNYKVFRNRHPGCVIDNTKYSAVRVGTLTDEQTPDWVILCVWLNDPDPAKFNVYQAAKLIFTYLDILLRKNGVWKKTLAIVFDLMQFSDQHVDLVTRYAARQILRLCQNAFPVKCGPIILLNLCSKVSQLTGYLGPFDFHIVDDFDDISGFLPKEYLPSDLGGFESNPTRLELYERYLSQLWAAGSRLAYEEIGWHKCYMTHITTETLPIAQPKIKSKKSKGKKGKSKGKKK